MVDYPKGVSRVERSSWARTPCFAPAHGATKLEPSPDFPMPECTNPAVREAREKRLFDEKAGTAPDA